MLQQALTFLTDAPNLPFAVSLMLMLLIGLVEAIGLGGAAIDLDHDVGGAWLGWLGLGRVPLLILLTVFLALFGTIGLAVQQVATALLGASLTPLIASGAALLGTLPLTGICARGLARIMPHDETTAVPLESLLGRAGVITLGRAEQGHPARARVADRHGQAHYVMVEPDNAGQIFQEGETILLVHRDADVFRGIAYDQSLLPRLEK